MSKKCCAGVSLAMLLSYVVGEASQTIQDSVVITGSSYPGLYFSNGNTSLAALRVDLSLETVDFGDMYSSAPSLALRLFTADLERMRISANGYVGIGTVSPDALLAVNGTMRSAAWQPYGSDAGDFYVDVEPGTRTLRTRNWNTGQPNVAATGIHTGFIHTEGFVGIGTTQPSSALDIASQSYGNAPFLILRNTNSTPSGAFGSGVVFLNTVPGSQGFVIQQRHTSPTYLSVANISAPYTEYLAINQNGNVGIGTTTQTHKLEVNGAIRAKEIIVESSGWSDFVFAPSHQLLALQDVEEYVRQHRRLPGIPSEQEVRKTGINVGEMQAKLLEKIEEITLHQIEQEKSIQNLTRENDSLRREVESLRMQLSQRNPES
jgi:hypothetical protein